MSDNFRMSEYLPISTIADAENLDSEEVVAGYRAGLRGAPERFDSVTRSWWHGWRNGRVDAGIVEPDAAQIRLAAAFAALDVANGKAA